MTEAIYYLDSMGNLWERVPEPAVHVLGSGIVTHPELGGSGVFWRKAPSDVLAEALARSKEAEAA